MRPVNVYVTMVSERHSGTYPYLFWTADEAIAYARARADQYASDPADIEELNYPGELYRVRWSPEQDYAWVVEQPIQGTAPWLIVNSTPDQCSLAPGGGCAGPVDMQRRHEVVQFLCRGHAHQFGSTAGIDGGVTITPEPPACSLAGEGDCLGTVDTMCVGHSANLHRPYP